jgi:hypothetical protein
MAGSMTQRSRAAAPLARQIGRGWLALVAAMGLGLLGCGGGGGGAPARLTTAELKDPSTCQTCHPAQFAQWSRSMHAYASDDPVFIAMNKRGQRETGGGAGRFLHQVPRAGRVA